LFTIFAQRNYNTRGGQMTIHKNTTRFLLVLSCLLFPGPGFSFDSTRVSFDQSQYFQKYQLKSDLQQLVVFYRNQAPQAGFLTGIGSDTMTISSEGRILKVPRSDLTRVIILNKGEDRTGLKLGMLIGFYGGNLKWYTAENQPTAFLTKGHNTSDLSITTIFANCAFIGLGGLLGHFFDTRLTNDIILDFTTDDQENLAAWQRIEKIFNPDPDAHKIHFCVYSSYLYMLATTQHRSFFKKYTGIANDRYPYDSDQASQINLIRRIQICYNLKPGLEIGPTLVFLGEPSFAGSRFESVNDNYFYYYLQEKLNSVGYYFSVSYHPFLSFQNKNNICWNMGLSLGVADFNYILETRFSSTSVAETMRQKNISKQTFSFLLSSELYFTRISTVAFGLQADFAFVPQQRINAVPEIGLPSRKLNFSNGGIGILIKINI
jgi:hypothetical protein